MSGIDLILTHLQFGKRIQNADLIITGEGSADAQTTMGKVAYGILREARKQNIPVLLVAGHIAIPLPCIPQDSVAYFPSPRVR